MARPNYGLEGPSLIATFSLLTAVSLAALVVTWLAPVSGFPVVAGMWIFFGVFLYCLLITLWILYSSKIGRIRLAKKVAGHLQLTGEKQVLVVGCGRGLYLCKIAHLLTSGLATGLDRWQGKHLTLNNARLEGVSEKVKLVEGGFPVLPFATESFDVVVSAASLPKKEERKLALENMLRVVKPEGRIVIVDIQAVRRAGKILEELGCSEVTVSRPFFATFPPSRVLVASKPRLDF